MLVRHSAIYLIGRLIPALTSVLALALFTRILTKQQYGYYALVIASTGVVNAVLFHWLPLSMARFLPSVKQTAKTLLSTTMVSFAVIALFVFGIGAVATCLWSAPGLRWFMLLAAVLTGAQAWFELNLQIANIRLKPVPYGIATSAKSVLAIGVGVLLFYLGLGVFGILIGLMIALVVSPMGLIKHWRVVSFNAFRADELHRLFRYGAPLTLTFVLIFVVNSSDRFFLAYFGSSASVGLYAPAYDLTQQSLGVLMNCVHLAAFPLAVTALELDGIQALQAKLKQNVLVLLGISVPAALGLIVLAPNIAFVLLGRDFQEHSAALIGIISLATLISGVRSFYFDYSFQLAKQLRQQVWVFCSAAMVNILLNFWLIPLYGVMGAAYATLVAFFVALVVSFFLGRRVFPMPKFSTEVLKLLPSCTGMAIGLYLIRPWRGLVALLVQVMFGSLLYGAMLLVTNYGGLMTRATALVLDRMKKGN